MNRTTLLAVAAIWATVAAGGAPGDAEDTTSTTEQGINSSASCFNTPADATFTGSGKVLTPATYDHSTCPKAFMVHLNNYSPDNTLGTEAVYAGAVSTTQADCDE